MACRNLSWFDSGRDIVCAIALPVKERAGLSVGFTETTARLRTDQLQYTFELFGAILPEHSSFRVTDQDPVGVRMRKLHAETEWPSLEKDITCAVALTNSKDLQDIRSFSYSLPPVDGAGASELHARRCDFLAEYGRHSCVPSPLSHRARLSVSLRRAVH